MLKPGLKDRENRDAKKTCQGDNQSAHPSQLVVHSKTSLQPRAKIICQPALAVVQ